MISIDVECILAAKLLKFIPHYLKPQWLAAHIGVFLCLFVNDTAQGKNDVSNRPAEKPLRYPLLNVVEGL